MVIDVGVILFCQMTTPIIMEIKQEKQISNADQLILLYIYFMQLTNTDKLATNRFDFCRFGKFGHT